MLCLQRPFEVEFALFRLPVEFPLQGRVAGVAEYLLVPLFELLGVLASFNEP